MLMADGLRLHVNALDYTLLTGYFIIVIAIGLAARRAIATSEDFFLSGRSLPGWITLSGSPSFPQVRTRNGSM